MSKELIERLRADAESTDDIGLCADAADRIEELEREIERKMSAAAFILKERDAMQADNARLREAMKEIRDDFDCDNDAHRYGTTCRCCLAEKTLSSTPEQSLAEYRNKVIEEHESQIADELEAWRARFDDDYEFRPGMGVVTMKKQP